MPKQKVEWIWSAHNTNIIENNFITKNYKLQRCLNRSRNLPCVVAQYMPRIHNENTGLSSQTLSNLKVSIHDIESLSFYIHVRSLLLKTLYWFMMSTKVQSTTINLQEANLPVLPLNSTIISWEPKHHICSYTLHGAATQHVSWAHKDANKVIVETGLEIVDRAALYSLTLCVQCESVL